MQRVKNQAVDFVETPQVDLQDIFSVFVDCENQAICMHGIAYVYEILFVVRSTLPTRRIVAHRQTGFGARSGRREGT